MLRNNLGQVVHTYVPLSPSSITWYRPSGGDALSAAGNVTAHLAESNGRLTPGGWLIVTCGLTACTPGSVLGPTLGNEYGKPLPLINWARDTSLWGDQISQNTKSNHFRGPVPAPEQLKIKFGKGEPKDEICGIFLQAINWKCDHILNFMWSYTTSSPIRVKFCMQESVSCGVRFHVIANIMFGLIVVDAGNIFWMIFLHCRLSVFEKQTT